MAQVPMEVKREAGLMVRTNNSVRTADLLAAHLLDPRARRYRQGENEKRRKWLYLQIEACYFIAHQKQPAWDAMTIDTDMLDASMMEDPTISNLTSVEIQDAFRAGVTGVYGEFYGITPKTLLGFLKSYVSSEKKLEAHRLITMREEKANKDANERLWQEIQKKKAEGMFVPSWGPKFNFKGEKKNERRINTGEDPGHGER